MVNFTVEEIKNAVPFSEEWLKMAAQYMPRDEIVNMLYAAVIEVFKTGKSARFELVESPFFKSVSIRSSSYMGAVQVVLYARRVTS